MSEHLKHSEGSAEKIPSKEIEKHQERLNELHEKAEKKALKSGHEKETIRHEVKEKAISGAEYRKPASEGKQQKAPVTKKDKEHVFDTVMHHVHQNMSKPEQVFSSFIHKPAVEKVSEVAGKTVARPSGIAGAAIAAFIGLLSVYSVAKFAGFELSGSEMPLLLLAGFLLGLIVEWVFKSLRVLFSPRSS